MNGEKSALKSKKFIAYIFAELLLAGVLVYALYRQPIDWPMTAFMGIGMAGLCALSIGYILSQKALDKFMRGLKGISDVTRREDLG